MTLCEGTEGEREILRDDQGQFLTRYNLFGLGALVGRDGILRYIPSIIAIGLRFPHNPTLLFLIFLLSSSLHSFYSPSPPLFSPLSTSTSPSTIYFGASSTSRRHTRRIASTYIYIRIRIDRLQKPKSGNPTCVSCAPHALGAWERGSVGPWMDPTGFIGKM